MLGLMTPLTRRLGCELKRDTPDNVWQARFVYVRVEPVYLAVVKVIRAAAPS